MKSKYLLCALFAASVFSIAQAQNSDSLMFRKIADQALLQGEAYSNLDYLCNKIGGRLSGSPQAVAAVEYTYEVMKGLGVDSVYLQPCMVPHWVRGDKEKAKILTANSGEYDAAICALGGSVATPPDGLTGDVVEVDSWEQLAKLGKAGKIKGKIVFYNRPFDQTLIQTFGAYGKAVDQRWKGPSEAARWGGIAAIVRTVGSRLDNYPHTGSMGYNDSLPKVPACAISTMGAEQLSKLLKSDPHVRFFFKMNCETLPDVKSYNVVGEIKGTEHPNDVIVVGGHLDSWDLAQGAQDDGAGAMQSIEVLRMFKELGIKPKCTIRAVMFMNEENGERGGTKYAELAKQNNEHTVAAIESDAGGFSPRGFGVDGTDAVRTKVQGWQSLFMPYGVYDFSSRETGADIEL